MGVNIKTCQIPFIFSYFYLSLLCAETHGSRLELIFSFLLSSARRVKMSVRISYNITARKEKETRRNCRKRQLISIWSIDFQTASGCAQRHHAIGSSLSLTFAYRRLLSTFGSRGNHIMSKRVGVESSSLYYSSTSYIADVNDVSEWRACVPLYIYIHTRRPSHACMEEDTLQRNNRRASCHNKLMLLAPPTSRLNRIQPTGWIKHNSNQCWPIFPLAVGNILWVQGYNLYTERNFVGLTHFPHYSLAAQTWKTNQNVSK